MVIKIFSPTLLTISKKRGWYGSDIPRIYIYISHFTRQIDFMYMQHIYWHTYTHENNTERKIETRRGRERTERKRENGEKRENKKRYLTRAIFRHLLRVQKIYRLHFIYIYVIDFQYSQ